MNKELLSKIKSELPKGAIAEIAKNAETSKGTVSNFLNGTSGSLKVMKAVTEYYAGYKKALNDINALASL